LGRRNLICEVKMIQVQELRFGFLLDVIIAPLLCLVRFAIIFLSNHRQALTTVTIFRLLGAIRGRGRRTTVAFDIIIVIIDRSGCYIRFDIFSVIVIVIVVVGIVVIFFLVVESAVPYDLRYCRYFLPHRGADAPQADTGTGATEASKYAPCSGRRRTAIRSAALNTAVLSV